MTKFKSYLILNLLIALLIFSIVGAIQANAFTDNAESGTGSWDGVEGSVSNAACPSPNPSLGNCFQMDTTASFLHKNITGQKYWSAVVRNTDATNPLRYYLKTDISRSNWIAMYLVGSSFGLSGLGSGLGIVDPAYLSVFQGWWYKIEAEEVGTQLTVRIYNATNSTLLFSSTVTTKTVAESTQIQLGVITSFAGKDFDNIYATVSAPAAAGATTITWDSDDYVKDDIGSYTWSISDATWAETYLWIKYDFWLDIYKNGFFNKEIQITSQSGTGYYTFADIGTYELRLKQEHILIPGSTLIGNDSIVIRNRGTPFIHVNESIPIKSPYRIDFMTGYNSNSIFLEEYRWANNDWLFTRMWRPVDVGVSSIKNIVVPGIGIEGEYIIKLVDSSKGQTLTQQKFKAYTPPPNSTSTENIATSSLVLNKGTYALGDAMLGQFAIDDYNWTRYSIYGRIYNNDRNMTTLRTDTNPYYSNKDQFAVQSGWFDLVVDSRTFFPSSNTFQIRGYNDTVDILIINASFIVSATTAEGFGLEVNKLLYSYGERGYVNVTTPGERVYLTIRKDGCNADDSFTQACYIEYYLPLNRSDVISFQAQPSGSYTAYLYTRDNSTGKDIRNIKLMRFFSVASRETTPTPTTTETGAEKVIAIAGLLDSNLFWALLFTVGMMAAVAYATVANKPKD